MKIVSIISLIVFSFLVSHSYADDSPKESCRNAANLYEEDDLTGAIEEAQWCLDLLKQEQATKVTSIFPDSNNGYKGGELESKNAMGFSTTSRNYSNGENQVSVTLSGTSGGVMDAFSSLAQLGMGAGMGQKMRIQKRNAVVMSEGNTMRIMVTLKKGGMLIFESSKLTKEQIIAFAKAFPIAELDESRS